MFGFEFTTLNPSAANTPLTFNLYAGGTLTGTSLFSTSFVLPTTISSRTTDAFVDLALPDIVVVPGSRYSAVITASSVRPALLVGPSFNVQANRLSGGDNYAGGRLLTNATAIYSNCQGAANNCDANFRVTGNLVGAAVPEPATWALMLLGFGAVGGSLRRRRQAVLRFA